MRAAMWWIDRWRQSDAFARMTAEEQGLYRNLCDEVVLRADGVIPDDQRMLAKASGDHEAWVRSGKSVLKSMKRVPGGWTNETAMEVRTESERRSKKQSDYRSKRASRGNDAGNASGNDAGNEPDNKPDNKPLPPEQEKDKETDIDMEKDQGRSVEADVTDTPNGTPVSDSTEGAQTNGVQQIGGEIRLTPQALGIRTDPGNFAQVQLGHDLTALVMAIGDPDKDPKSEALALLHAISATPKGVKIETLDLRRVPSNWAAVTTHAAFKLAADHGVDLALVDGWRTARTPANAPEPKAPEMATTSTEPRTCALCGGPLRSKGGLYICADSLAVGCTWMVRTDQPALKSNAA